MWVAHYYLLGFFGQPGQAAQPAEIGGTGTAAPASVQRARAEAQQRLTEALRRRAEEARKAAEKAAEPAPEPVPAEEANQVIRIELPPTVNAAALAAAAIEAARRVRNPGTVDATAALADAQASAAAQAAENRRRAALLLGMLTAWR